MLNKSKFYLSLIIFSSLLAFNANADTNDNIIKYCKSGKDLAFLKAISIDDETFKQYVPKGLIQGTKDANSNLYYPVQNDNIDSVVFPFKNDNKNNWVDRNPDAKAKASFTIVRAIKKNDLEFNVTWQRAIPEYNSKGEASLLYSYGNSKELHFIRENTKTCWKLREVYTIQY